MKSFYVAGIYHKNKETDKQRRIDFIQKYSGVKSKFKLEREPGNQYDANAIMIKQVFKSGGSVCIGYVPNSKKKRLADQLAPLMDEHGLKVKVLFGRRWIDEKSGELKGLMLRYKTR
jgi:hypothetical protein